MIIVPEPAIAGLITEAATFEAVEPVFAAMARGAATNFPVMREPLGGGRQCGFESGQDRRV
jgi:ornithine cyclodeaminase